MSITSKALSCYITLLLVSVFVTGNESRSLACKGKNSDLTQ